MLVRRLCIFLLLFATRVFAQQPVNALQTRLQRATTDSDRISLYLQISRAYTLNEPDSAVDYCTRGIQLANKLNDKQSQGQFLLQMGMVNTVHRHPDLARQFLNEALSIFRNQNDKDGLARAYDALGMLDAAQKNTSMATRDINYAMKFYEDSHDTAGLLEAYHGMGAVYEEKGDLEHALSFYLRALVQYEHHTQKPDAYYILLDRIGHLYLKKGNSQTALHYLQEGVSNSNTPAVRDTQITLLTEEGQVYERQGKSAQALVLYKQALSEAKKFKRPEEQARALINIAHLLKKQNAAQSLDDLKSALTIAAGLHEPRLEASIFEAMASVYRQQNDYREAMNALEEQHHLLDSLLNADTAKDIAALSSSYKLESSEEKITDLQQTNRMETKELYLGWVILAAAIAIMVLLWQYVRKVRRLNRELHASNRIKDTLFSIIGHDLKGPAGSAAQMFAVMETEKFSEEELRIMIAELRKQTEASFELLNALFEWGKAQLRGVNVNPEKVDIKAVVEQDISLLSTQSNQKQITMHDHIQAGTLVFADPHHVDFVLRNLISNAIKFTHEGGSIDINASEGNDEIVLSVRDTGVGISAQQQDEFMYGQLPVNFGTKGEKGSGLGLLLTKEFIKANHGRIWLNSRPEKGTTFYFSLPIAKA